MANEVITEIPLEQLHESPFNPRKIFTGIEELAVDIKQHGRVLQPLLVRPHKNPLFRDDPDGATGFELVFGHRRLRASKLADMPTARCEVCDMTDEQVKRAQLSENLSREDVHPIEEALGFQALIDEHGMTADLIAAQFGKSRSHVYARLKLLHLHPTVRAACLAGEIGSEAAVLLARLRTEKLQEKALGYIRNNWNADLKDGGKKSHRIIQNLLVEKFTLDLKGAIFDTADALLLPDAGPCTTCPKRTANAPEFADVVDAKRVAYSSRPAGPDVCTDPDCFDAKKKAHLKNKAAELESKGKTVVDGNKARAAVSAQGEVKGAFVALKDVREAIKKSGKKVDTVVIQNPRDGKAIDAVRREDLKAAGVKLAEPKKVEKYDYEAEHARTEALAKTEGAVRLAMLNKVLEAAAAAPRSTLDLQMVAHVAFAGVDYNDRTVLAQLYGGGNRDDVHKKIGSMDTATVALFALTCALVQDVATHTGNYQTFPKALTVAAKAYGIDLDAIRKGLQAPAESASTPSLAARAPKKAATDGAKKKATKRVGKAFHPTHGVRPAGEKQTDDAGSAGAENGALFEEADA